MLATELQPSGVAVIAVEPGAYNTDILKPALARSVTKGFEADRSGMKPPDEVATAVLMRLNADEAYTYERAALNQMMDNAVTKTGETQR